MATISPTTVRSAIEAANREFMDAVRRADPGAVAALYSRSGMLLPPHAPLVEGPAEIERFWAGALDAGLTGISLVTREVEVHDDHAYEVGEFTLRAAGSADADDGKYVVIWRHEGEHWRIHRDIWNSNRTADGA